MTKATLTRTTFHWGCLTGAQGQSSVIEVEHGSIQAGMVQEKVRVGGRRQGRNSHRGRCQDADRQWDLGRAGGPEVQVSNHSLKQTEMCVAGKVQHCPKEIPGQLWAGPQSVSIRNYRGLVRGLLPCPPPPSLFSAWTQSPETASRGDPLGPHANCTLLGSGRFCF